MGKKIFTCLLAFFSLNAFANTFSTEDYKELGNQVTYSHGGFAHDGEPLQINDYLKDGTLKLHNLNVLVLLNPNHLPTIIPLIESDEDEQES